MNHYKNIRLWICLLVAAACLNTCMPLMTLHNSLAMLVAGDSGDDPDDGAPDESQEAKDERDNDDERTDDDDRDPTEIEKDYLGVVDDAQYHTYHIKGWSAIDESRLHDHVIEILVPPPKHHS